MQRIPTLDGWRGIAILLVLFEHFTSFKKSAWLPSTGQHGVTVFFVLSGFLITHQLWEEKTSIGDISLTKFYWRRVFRIIPCAWLYLGCFFFMHLVTGFPPLHELFASVFFYRNQIPEFGVSHHFWSLSLEEQFYLVWPVALTLLNKRWTVIIVSVSIVAIALHRLVFWSFYSVDFRSFHTIVRADALLVGCLLAMLWSLSIPQQIFKSFTALPLLAAFVFCVLRYTTLIPLFESVTVAGLIAAGLAEGSPLGRILEVPFLKKLGLLSYSIYVWQEPFYLILRHTAKGLVLLPLLVPIAAASYYCIERPIVRYSKRSKVAVEQTHGVVNV